MNITALKTYLEELSEKHKSICHSSTQKHFWADIDELMDEIKGKATSPIVVMGPPAFEPVDDAKDNVQERNTLSILILTYVKPRAGIKADQTNAYDTCKILANDFMSYMLNDERELQNGILLTNPNNFRVELAGPIMDNYYGVELFIEFNDALDLSFDPDKWNE